jgi:hypothetical protein
MPHQPLRDSRRNTGSVRHRRHLAPQRVEVKNVPGRIPVLDAGGFQVDPQHPGALFGQSKHGLARSQHVNVGP